MNSSSVDKSSTAPTAAANHTLDVELDTLGQLPFLQIYTQISLFFPVTDVAVHGNIIETLKRGLDRLSYSCPWVAGQVVQRTSSDGSSSVYKIESYSKAPEMVVEDLRRSGESKFPPSMKHLRESNFPMSMLDEDLIAARRTLPGGPKFDPSAPSPVFIVKVNWVQGGAILTFNGHHAAMDMTGQCEVIRLLSNACKNKSFTEQELELGNMVTRRCIVEKFAGGSNSKRGDTLHKRESEFWNRPSPGDSDTGSSGLSTNEPAIWVYFSFSKDSLSDLKAEAERSLADFFLSNNENSTSTTRFISTDDSLCAFVWKSVIRSCLPRFDHQSATVKLSRAVDVRSAVGAPTSYPGLLQLMTHHKTSVKWLEDAPIGVIASMLRSELDPESLKSRTLELIELIKTTPDKTNISFVPADADVAMGLMVSSWSKMSHLWDLDFGMGVGRPESVKRPKFTPYEGLMYLMPKAPDGEVSLAISLRKDDLERLKSDETFCSYASFVG